MNVNYQYYKTKIGELILGSFGEKLCLLDFKYRKMRNSVDARLKNSLKASFVEEQSEVIDSVKKQLEEYLSGKRKQFEISYLTVGTDFQKRVWNELCNIDYGKTVSYLDIAKKLNNRCAVRAVAAANAANAIALVIPCHRAIQNNGELGGYGGGVLVKEKLLNLEWGIN